MKRNKYVNSFNTTSEFDNYIESAEPGFPNVALTKDDGNVHYTRTSPNDHYIYGELIENYTAAPVFTYNWVGSSYKKSVTNIDTLNNTFYLDSSDILYAVTGISWSFNGTSENNANRNIKSIKKFNIDTTNITSLDNMFSSCTNLEYVNFYGVSFSNVTSVYELFKYCSNLTTINLTGCDFSNVTQTATMFFGCSSLTDVYITVEATLMKLTNNLSSQGDSYIPSSATIHYDNGTGNVDYKWQNNAWTPQS